MRKNNVVSVINSGLSPKMSAGNDTLDARDGAVTDVLAGGKGADIYYIDVISEDGDRIIEEADGGLDTVRAKGTCKLADNVENLELLEVANINGTGNQSDNKITGNNGATGGAANDCNYDLESVAA